MKELKKVINVTTMVVVGQFYEEETEEIIEKYESMGYIDVSKDIDGDVCIWEDEDD